MVDEDKENEGSVQLSTAGNAIASAAGSGPVTALLTPAAKVFGEYFGLRAKEITDGWKRQREKNLETHVGKVLEKEGPPIPREPTEKQVVLVSEWVERAQEVDPEDPEIAALWQSLLGAIYQKETNAKEWLEAIKQLNESDARLLLRIPRNFEPANSRERAQASKLVSLGLLEDSYWPRFRESLHTNLFSAFMGLIIIGFVLILPLFDQRWEFTKPIGIGIGSLMIAGTAVMFAFRYTKDINRYSVTDFGRDIRRSAWRYLQNLPRVAESEMKEAMAAAEAKPEFEPARGGE